MSKNICIIFLTINLMFNMLISEPCQAENKTNIAVINFVNNTDNPKLDYLQTGLADILASELTRFKELNLIERNRIKELINEFGYSESGFVDQEKNIKLGKHLGVSMIVMGSLVKTGSKYQLSVRLIDVETSKIKYAVNKEASNQDEFSKLTANIAKEFAKELGSNIEDNYNPLLAWLLIGSGVVVAGIATGVILSITGVKKYEFSISW